MPVRLEQLPVDIRETTVAALRRRRPKLARDLANGLFTEQGLDGINLADFAGTLLTILSAAIKTGWIDARTAAVQELARFAPPVTVRQLIKAVHHAERIALGAAALSDRFRNMVRQRLVFTDDTTGQTTPVTLSAAVGTELVNGELESRSVMAEAEAAVLRAQMNGGNRMERVGLLTSVTILGAANLLGVPIREIMRLVRSRKLHASRRGRHLHIDRDAVDEYRRRG